MLQTKNCKLNTQNALSSCDSAFFLFIPQGFDGVEFGCFPGRVDAEEEADADGEAEGDDDRCCRDDCLEEARLGDSQGDADAAGDAQEAADDADDDGFDEELHHDVLEGRAQGFTDADFPRPFSDGDHHDVHDADAADDERNGGDTAQEEGQHGRRAGHGFHEARQVADVEVVFLAVHDVMALAQQRFDFGLDLFDFIGAGDLDVDGADVGNAHEAFLGRRQGDDDDIVLVLAHGGLALAFQDADDLVRLVVDADVLADRVGFVEEVGRDRRSDDGDAVARVEVALCDEGARLDDEGADVQVFRRDAVDRCIPVLVAVDDLIGTVDCRRYVVDVLYLVLDGRRVVVF